MMVKVLRPTYFAELRDSAYKAYSDKLKLDMKKLEDAYHIKEADAKTYGRHAPSNGADFDLWFKQLQKMNEDVEQAFNEYTKAFDRYKDERYSLTPECKYFVNRYEEEHYKPTEEDYVEVCMSESHASPVEGPKPPIEVAANLNLGGIAQNTNDV